MPGGAIATSRPQSRAQPRHEQHCRVRPRERADARELTNSRRQRDLIIERTFIDAEMEDRLRSGNEEIVGSDHLATFLQVGTYLGRVSRGGGDCAAVKI